VPVVPPVADVPPEAVFPPVADEPPLDEEPPVAVTPPVDVTPPLPVLPPLDELLPPLPVTTVPPDPSGVPVAPEEQANAGVTSRARRASFFVFMWLVLTRAFR